METVPSYGVWGKGVAWGELPFHEISLVRGKRIGGRVAKSEVLGTGEDAVCLSDEALMRGGVEGMGVEEKGLKVLM